MTPTTTAGIEFCGECGALAAVAPTCGAEPMFRAPNSDAQVLGARPAAVGLGKLYRRMGKREQAQEHLTTATTMYREMGMRFWLEQADATIRELTRRR